MAGEALRAGAGQRFEEADWRLLSARADEEGMD